MSLLSWLPQFGSIGNRTRHQPLHRDNSTAGQLRTAGLLRCRWRHSIARHSKGLKNRNKGDLVLDRQCSGAEQTLSPGNLFREATRVGARLGARLLAAERRRFSCWHHPCPHLDGGGGGPPYALALLLISIAKRLRQRVAAPLAFRRGHLEG